MSLARVAAPPKRQLSLPQSRGREKMPADCARAKTATLNLRMIGRATGGRGAQEDQDGDGHEGARVGVGRAEDCEPRDKVEGGRDNAGRHGRDDPREHDGCDALDREDIRIVVLVPARVASKRLSARQRVGPNSLPLTGSARQRLTACHRERARPAGSACNRAGARS